MNKWALKKNKELPGGAEFSGFNPVLLQLLIDRGLSTVAEIRKFLAPNYQEDLPDPFLLKGMEEALKRIAQAREKKEKILIFGDYDADGITSSAILKKTVEALGFEAEVYIPDKEKEGYGLNNPAIEEFAKNGFSLMITVDCGMANWQEIDYAKSLGVETIVVDHHHIPLRIPQALAIINPHLPDSNYPFQELAGVGVTFKFCQALYQRFLPQAAEQLKWFLDLVAIGTIADCVPLVGENRVFAKYGLIVLSKTRSVGLRELFKVGRIAIDENNIPDSHQVAFQIAPRLNAAGRMDHADVAYDLIMETDQVHSRELALDLEAKNQQRQKVTALVVEEVRILAENMFKDKKFIFAVGEHFPSGIVGLVAGRIADAFGKPTAIFQKKEKESKGSFRSIPQLNIIETIEKCSELAVKFGGHSQAAGVTIANENLNPFFEKMSVLIEEKLKGKELTRELEIDRELFPKDIDFLLTESLKKMEPFGEGNRQPVFLMKNLLIQDLKIVGNGSKHLKLFLQAQDGTPKIFEAIGFGLAPENVHLKIGDKVDVVFNLEEDEWNGNRKLQLKIVDIKKLS